LNDDWLQFQLGARANGFHEAVDGVRRERAPALGLEDRDLGLSSDRR
jgi:hypothetical protein